MKTIDGVSRITTLGVLTLAAACGSPPEAAATSDGSEALTTQISCPAGDHKECFSRPPFGITTCLCESGPLTLASSLSMPSSLAVDESRVYWTNFGSSLAAADGTVMACGIGGCAAPTVLATGQAAPAHIAADSSNVYWNDLGGNVMAVSKQGGAPTVLAAATAPYEIAIDSANVYWTVNSVFARPTALPAEIRACPKTGCGPSGPRTVMNGAYANSSLTYLTTDGSSLYFYDGAGTGQIMSCPNTGCTTPTVLVAGYEVQGLAVDNRNVYFTKPGGVYSCGKTWGCSNVPNLVAPDNTGTFLWDVAVDGSNVYWDSTPAPSGSPSVKACSLSGCTTPTTLASGGGGVFSAITVDSANAYWVTDNPGSIRQMIK
jgi:hypothetical protein